jgi:hypothetical protein
MGLIFLSLYYNVQHCVICKRSDSSIAKRTNKGINSAKVETQISDLWTHSHAKTEFIKNWCYMYTIGLIFDKLQISQRDNNSAIDFLLENINDDNR